MARRGLRQQNTDEDVMRGDDNEDDVNYVDCPVCWGQGGKCRFCRNTGMVHPDDVDPILDVFQREKRQKTYFMAGSIGVVVLLVLGLVLVGFFSKEVPKTILKAKDPEKDVASGAQDLKMDQSMAALLNGFKGHIDTLEKTAVRDPIDGWAYMGYTSDPNVTRCSMIAYGSEERVTHALFCATIPVPEGSDPSISPEILSRNTKMLELFLFNVFRGQVPPVARETIDMARKNPGREAMEVARGLKIKCKYSTLDKKFTIDVR
jgi:hypothetical protein